MKKFFSLLLLNYFRLFAKAQIAKVSLLQKLSHRSLTIVGITGSAGKSSTLNACEATLKDYFTVKTNAGSNSESGIPFSILGIKAGSYSPIDWLKYTMLAPVMLIANWHKYDILLLEMGIDEPEEPKNMSYLLKIVQPTIGIFLNVNLVHSLQFDKTVSRNITGSQRESQILANIGREKARLINSLPSSGFALLNIDDPTVSQTTQIALAQKVILKPIHLEFDNYCPPKSFAISVSAAINLAKIFKIDPILATRSLQQNLILPPSRSTIFRTKSGLTVLDSSYNSSPHACAEMLEVLSQYPSPRIAVLGDMRELGLQTPIAHERIYRQALKSADTIISVGPETTKYFGDKAIKFSYWWQASEYIKQHLQPQSTILVKGSQNTIFLEEIVKDLVGSPTNICRQSPYWTKTKQKFKKERT